MMGREEDIDNMLIFRSPLPIRDKDGTALQDSGGLSTGDVKAFGVDPGVVCLTHR